MSHSARSTALQILRATAAKQLARQLAKRDELRDREAMPSEPMEVPLCPRCKAPIPGAGDAGPIRVRCASCGQHALVTREGLDYVVKRVR